MFFSETYNQSFLIYSFIKLKMQNVGYHHIVWKQLFELPLKYFQQFLRMNKLQVPSTYRRFLELYPKYFQSKFIEQIIKWLQEYDNGNMRFNLYNQKTQDKSSGTQGSESIKYINSKIFDSLVEGKIKGRDVEHISSQIKLQMKNSYEMDLYFDSRCLLKNASPRKTAQEFNQIKTIAFARFVQCLEFLNHIAPPQIK